VEARVSAGTLRERLAALPPLPPEPRVSVLMAVRNEARHLEAALAAVRGQDWPHERLEVLVIDGDSDDGTRDVAGRVAAGDPRVRLLANPARFVAQGLNLGLAAARGEVIVRVDGHCRVPAGYVRAGVEALRDGRGECAGGPVRAQGGSAFGRTIALAMSTPFGVGGASFRWSRVAREVDHLPFGVWRREVFEWLGGFDEALRRNQDDEFSDRFRRAGGRIWMQPEALVEYWSRDSLGGLARQYFGYGFWKVRVIRKRGGLPSSPRHLAPAALWLAALGGALAAVAARNPLLAAIVPGAYAAFLALATLVTLATRRQPEALLLPLVLPVLHGAYGAGFLAAIARPADASLSPGADEPSIARAA
jgi:GT2 family glycosyltransferase